MPDHDLTEADVALLGFLSQGWTSQRIATELGAPVRRVRNDVKAVRSKLNARNNTHAVVLALRAHIL